MPCVVPNSGANRVSNGWPGRRKQQRREKLEPMECDHAARQEGGLVIPFTHKSEKL